MINYKNKSEGMIYTKNGIDYTIHNGLFKVSSFKQEDNMVNIHIYNDEYDCTIKPFIDRSEVLKENMTLKVAYVIENGNMICHGYEESKEDLIIQKEPKNVQLEEQEVNVPKLMMELNSMIDMIRDTSIRELVTYILSKYQDQILTWQAAVSVHHNIESGLLLHLVMVARNVLSISNSYNDINLDIALAGAILHDIGKIKEYNEDGTISEEGQMSDHISIGSRILNECAKESFSAISKRDLEHINHIILSHHGKLEWGSTKIPATLEAFIVHQADYIDTQMYIYHTELKTLGIGDSRRNKYIGSNIVQTNNRTDKNYNK